MIGSLWNRKVEVVILIVSLAFNAGVGVTAGVRSYQDRCERQERSHRGRGFNLLEGLNLRADQIEPMQAAQETMSTELREMHRTIRDEQAVLTELLLAVEPDQAAIADRITEISALKEGVHRRMVDHLLEIKAGLDGEQVEAFNEVLARRMARWHGGRDGRGGHRRGPRGEYQHRRQDSRAPDRARDEGQ